MSDRERSVEDRSRAEYRKVELQGDEEFTEDELRLLLEVSQDLASITGFDGYFRLLSPSWERELGWTREELRARPFMEFVHPDDRGKTKIAEQRLRPGTNLLSFHNRYLCKDGSFKILRWHGMTSNRTQRYYMMTRVLTHELHAREQASALDALFEMSAEALIMEGQGGTIIRWSGAAQKLFGHRAADVTGRQTADFLCSVGGEGIDLLALEEANEAGDDWVPAAMRRADGSTAAVLVAVRPFSDGSAPVTGAVAALTLA